MKVYTKNWIKKRGRDLRVHRNPRLSVDSLWFSRITWGVSHPRSKLLHQAARDERLQKGGRTTFTNYRMET